MASFECQVEFRYLRVLYIEADNREKAHEELIAMSNEDLEMEFEYETSHAVFRRNVIAQEGEDDA